MILVNRLYLIIKIVTNDEELKEEIKENITNNSKSITANKTC